MECLSDSCKHSQAQYVLIAMIEERIGTSCYPQLKLRTTAPNIQSLECHHSSWISASLRACQSISADLRMWQRCKLSTSSIVSTAMKSRHSRGFFHHSHTISSALMIH